MLENDSMLLNRKALILPLVVKFNYKVGWDLAESIPGPEKSLDPKLTNACLWRCSISNTNPNMNKTY